MLIHFSLKFGQKVFLHSKQIINIGKQICVRVNCNSCDPAVIKMVTKILFNFKTHCIIIL